MASAGVVVVGGTIIAVYETVTSWIDSRQMAESAEDDDSNSSGKSIRSKSRAPEKGEPNSTWEQENNETERVKSRTKYNEDGNWEYRDDYVSEGARDHYDKNTDKYIGNHRHIKHYNENGQPIGEDVIPLN